MANLEQDRGKGMGGTHGDWSTEERWGLTRGRSARPGSQAKDERQPMMPTATLRGVILGQECAACYRANSKKEISSLAMRSGSSSGA
jgi:hypothetical protein